MNRSTHVTYHLLVAVVSGSIPREGLAQSDKPSVAALCSRGVGITANVSSVCDVKNGHTAKFAMKHGFFVFKSEGRKFLKYFYPFTCIYRIYGIYLHHN